MTPKPQHDLYPPERPVRSHYASDRSYARRRAATVGVLVLVLGGVIYGLWGRHTPNPADIPTITGETAFKQKPADPGGIDIPHQDVRIYDELEGKNAPQPAIEHLLPPPETPQEVPHAAAASPAVTVAVTAPTPPPVPVPAVSIAAAPKPAAAPQPDIGAPPLPSPIATTASQSPSPVAMAVKKVVIVAPTPAPPSASASAPISIDQVIQKTMAPSVSAAATPPATGSTAVQLASASDQTKAQAMLQELQHKYAAQLNGASLHLATANLGSRGTFYRIQSQGMSEDSANQICSALKKSNAGCILVRK